MAVIKRVALLLALALLIVVAYALGVGFDLFGEHEGPGVVTKASIPKVAMEARRTRQAEVQSRLGMTSPAKQILFGDLHVHTTFSRDAFVMSLPFLQGEGAHPPADACDFARFCSNLDFWGISDHAEGLTPRHWRETKESIRQCNALNKHVNEPETVAFLGFEWSQSGKTRETHYGHKNVFFSGTAEGAVPARAIASKTGGLSSQFITGLNVALAIYDFPNRKRYFDHQRFQRESDEVPRCQDGVASPDLSENCNEIAKTPEVLFRKLDEWGFDTLVIPHGNAWGITAPVAADFVTQLNSRQHDPARQRLIEVYSGHGNSEEYRPWKHQERDDAGEAVCPPPSGGFVPGCWRASEIIYARCQKEGTSEDECQARREEAMKNYMDAGLLRGFATTPGASADEWAASGQCQDCFLPAFHFLPQSSVQYALALSDFEPGASEPLRFRFGLIGSSDNHAAKAGTGYKEFDRTMMTESRAGPRNLSLRRKLIVPNRGDTASRSIAPENLSASVKFDTERYASFAYTGGLVAVHSEGRAREAIWKALKERDVYATSGPRILLWFDLLNPFEHGSTTLPMGGATRMNQAPRFRVRAAGSFAQIPGCPDYAIDALTPEGVARLCRGECYNPSDQRYRIRRIEVVRIRPQTYAGEPVKDLIEDPWRVLACPEGRDGCEVEFEDDSFPGSARDALYYVRAIQEPTPAVNGDPFACGERDDAGICLTWNRCSQLIDSPSDCLADVEERAWSSPIFVDFMRSDAVDVNDAERRREEKADAPTAG